MSHTTHHAQSAAVPVQRKICDVQEPPFNSTPARYKRNTVNSTLNFTLPQARGELRVSMRGKLDIPSTIKEFMDLHVKDYYPQLNENIFANAPTFATEMAMYQYITDTINNSAAVNSENLVCASTPYKSDRNDATHQAVDLGLYPPKLKPINEGDGEYNRRINWSCIDLSIECKVHPTDQDPFDETANDLLPTAADRKKALGQILTYVENVFMHQHRTLHYMILFLGHFARIVRFDHSGVYATTKFNYKNDGAILTTFLSRYSAYSAMERGYDPTATRLERRDPLVGKMRKFGQAMATAKPGDHAQQMFNASLNNAWPWYKLEVHAQPNSDEPKPPLARLRSFRQERVTRSFVVGKPHFDAGGVVGRGTRGYVAVEVDARGELVGPFVYLKDAWRVDHPGIEQEGCVLEDLNRHEVPFVPTLVCHGDLEGQVTKSQDAWARRQAKNRKLKCTFKRHQHYRLVVAEVGKPLEKFQTGARLVAAIYCCLLAHQAAYERAGIIHRDISSGNILLHQDANGIWYGLLNDWELSKKVGSPAARQPDRTGTWQFMSVRALNNPEKDITIEDEIEAFFHVLLYHAIRFLPHNIKPESVPQFLVDYFDSCCVMRADEYGCGATKQAVIRHGVIELAPGRLTDSSEILKFLNPEDKGTNHPINALIQRLLTSFRAAYARNPDTSKEGVARRVDSLNDFMAMLGAMPNVRTPIVPAPVVPAAVAPPKPVKTRSKGKQRAPLKPSMRRGRKAAVGTATHAPAAAANATSGPAAATASSSSPSDDQGPISLKEHGPVIALFWECIQRSNWPLDDKGQDLREKVKADITLSDLEAPDNTGESENKSKKRQLDDAHPAPGSSKRSR